MTAPLTINVARNITVIETRKCHKVSCNGNTTSVHLIHFQNLVGLNYIIIIFITYLLTTTKQNVKKLKKKTEKCINSFTMGSTYLAILLIIILLGYQPLYTVTHDVVTKPLDYRCGQGRFTADKWRCYLFRANRYTFNLWQETCRQTLQSWQTDSETDTMELTDDMQLTDTMWLSSL